MHHPDVVECLTAHGPALHVMALGEGCCKLSIDRPLAASEHGRLQGFSDSIVAAFASTPCHIAKRAYGNAMSVPVIGAILARELRSLLRTYADKGLQRILSQPQPTHMISATIAAQAPSDRRETTHPSGADAHSRQDELAADRQALPL